MLLCSSLPWSPLTALLPSGAGVMASELIWLRMTLVWLNYVEFIASRSCMGASISPLFNAKVLGRKIISNYIYTGALQNRGNKSFFFYFMVCLAVRRKYIQTIAFPCNEFKYTTVSMLLVNNLVDKVWKRHWHCLEDPLLFTKLQQFLKVHNYVSRIRYLVCVCVCVCVCCVCDHSSAPTLLLGFSYFKQITLG